MLLLCKYTTVTARWQTQHVHVTPPNSIAVTDRLAEDVYLYSTTPVHVIARFCELGGFL